MSTTLLDTHIHLYPNYDLAQALHHFLDNTAKLGRDITRVACLAERHDCQFFQALHKGKIALDQFNITHTADKTLQITREDDAQLILLPGRQIITSENIEVLALACAQMIDDKQPAVEVINQINQLNGIAVIAWSPGKWFGQRGQLIKSLIEQMDPDDFMLGDTTLRPYGWLTPRLIKYAQHKGFGVIAGSDPLPFAGEESWLGAFYSVLETAEELNAKSCLHHMRTHKGHKQAWKNQGKRSTFWQLGWRLKKNAASKRQG